MRGDQSALAWHCTNHSGVGDAQRPGERGACWLSQFTWNKAPQFATHHFTSRETEMQDSKGQAHLQWICDSA